MGCHTYILGHNNTHLDRQQFDPT